MNNLQKAEMGEKDNWNQHWKDFDTAAQLNPAQKYRRLLLLSSIAAANTNGGIRLLDIGSGQGDFALGILKSFPKSQVLGIELSASGVGIAKKKAPMGNFIQQDLTLS